MTANVIAFATSLLELRVSTGCFFAAVSGVGSMYFETDYGEREGPFFDTCREGSCYELWVGRWYLVAERTARRVD